MNRELGHPPFAEGLGGSKGTATRPQTSSDVELRLPPGTRPTVGGFHCLLLASRGAGWNSASEAKPQRLLGPLSRHAQHCARHPPAPHKYLLPLTQRLEPQPPSFPTAGLCPRSALHPNRSFVSGRGEGGGHCRHHTWSQGEGSDPPKVTGTGGPETERESFQTGHLQASNIRIIIVATLHRHAPSRGAGHAHRIRLVPSCLLSQPGMRNSSAWNESPVCPFQPPLQGPPYPTPPLLTPCCRQNSQLDPKAPAPLVPVQEPRGEDFAHGTRIPNAHGTRIPSWTTQME